MGRPDSFSGRDSDWPTWTFVARPYLESLHTEAGSLLDHSETATGEEVALESMGDQAKEIARKLYLVLVPGLKGKALNIAKRTPRNNGFALWRALVREYEPTVAGRHASMLMGLLSPDWASKPNVDFAENLTIVKVPGQINPADIGTKPLAGPRLRSLLLMLQMAGVAEKKEISAVSRELVLDPGLVSKVLWLSALFEQISKIKATEVVSYDGQTETEMVCRAAPGLTEKVYDSVCWWARLLAAFIGGWIAKTCLAWFASTRPAETPMGTPIVTPVMRPVRTPMAQPAREIVMRTMKTQSQTTYHMKWRTPKFGVLAEGEQGAWPEAIFLG